MEGLKKEYKLEGGYSQPNDCMAPEGSEDYQFLDIQTEDGGGGTFYVMKTERWAFESPKEVYDLLNEFAKKFKKLSDD
jgi:hypothetical protein